jgi:hypothetical protein
MNNLRLARQLRGAKSLILVNHADCGACHTSHQGPRRSREICLGCHRAQRGHEPTAQVCTGCHVFRR